MGFHGALNAQAADLALPSAGSARHTTGTCTPCILFAKGPGVCKQAEKCKYCHVPDHGVTKSSKSRMRPGKGKRDRYQKFAQKVIGMIDNDPEGFDINQVNLPTSIEKNDRLKHKFTRRMQGHHEAVNGQPASEGDVDEPASKPKGSSAIAGAGGGKNKKQIM